MPTTPIGPQSTRRTAAEAVAQADAKYRIRFARGVRLAGGGVAGLGAYSFLPRHAQSLASRLRGSGLDGLSARATVGIAAFAVGLLMLVIGHMMLQRAIARAKANPVTARVIDQAMTGHVERLL